MAQYSLAAGIYTAATLPGAIGNLYNVGLSDGTRYYGYVFKNDGQQSEGFKESTDTTSKESLTQYSSGQLIDRDLAFFPRITDGDFSGGGYQEVWIDTTKYFDSDLDPRVPGFLQLRAQWTRINKTGISNGTGVMVIPWNGDFWYTFSESNSHIYSANGAQTFTTGVSGSVIAIDTDGQYLYSGSGSGLARVSTSLSGEVNVATALNGTATRWWVLNQGTGGYFAYYLVGTNLLYKIDLTASFPVAAGSQPQVPMGSNAVQIVDLVQYQNGLAILTNDVAGVGFDVWYHDGTNLTRIVRVDGYNGQGITNCLGNLYVGANAVAKVNSPVLALVSGGQFQIVAKPGSPFPTAHQGSLQPRSGGQYVYWPITGQSISGIANGRAVIVQYDVLTGAVMHLPNFDATDFTSATGPLRSVAILGESVAACFVNSTTGILQYQISTFGTIKYQSSGWLASSHIDFGTPGIVKRFRRIEVQHAPLNAGESIYVEAHVEQDPLAFTTSLGPNPANASATNSTLGSVVTVLTMGADTVGKTMYFAVKLNAGTSNNTTPRVSYVSVEIGGTWAWEFDFDCTSRRRLLTQAGEDQQGVSGKDLRFLIRNAYENGSTLTLYIFGQTYTVAIESEKAQSVAYVNHAGTTVKADEEWFSHVVLRQVA